MTVQYLGKNWVMSALLQCYKFLPYQTKLLDLSKTWGLLENKEGILLFCSYLERAWKNHNELMLSWIHGILLLSPFSPSIFSLPVNTMTGNLATSHFHHYGSSGCYPDWFPPNQTRNKVALHPQGSQWRKSQSSGMISRKFTCPGGWQCCCL